ncbi:hypothetical protein ACT0EJ_005346, partial [Escherichia coli]
MDLSDGAATATARGSCPGADAKVFDACGKKFCGWYIFPWTAAPCCGRFSPRKVHSGKQAAGVAAEGLTAPSGAVALHTVRCAGSAVSGA